MNKLKIILLAAILFFFGSGCTAQSQTNSLQLIETIQLQNISGRIDHLSFNEKNNLVFVAALGNNTVEVVDLKNKKLIHSIKNLHEPQGVAFIPENNSLVVANGDNGECDVFNASDFQKKIQFSWVMMQTMFVTTQQVKKFMWVAATAELQLLMQQRLN